MLPSDSAFPQLCYLKFLCK